MELGIGHGAWGMGHWLMYGTRSAGFPSAPVPYFCLFLGLTQIVEMRPNCRGQRSLTPTRYRGNA